MRRFRLRRMALIAASIAVLCTAVAATAQGDGPGRAVLADTKPAWTAAASATNAVPSTASGISVKVWLAPRNAAQLDALATAVSEPSSAQYGQFISAAQYRAQFAPTADQVAQVTKWLSDAGLTVSSVGADNRFVAASASAAAVSAAFGTSLQSYVVNGHAERAPAADLSVPGQLAGVVEAVTGLTTFGHRVKPAFGPPDAFVSGTPCSAYYGEQLAKGLPKFHGKVLPINPCGYTPTQLRGAYGVDQAGTGGTGSTVAITDAYDAPTLLADANTYAGLHGDAPFTAGQFSDLSVAEDPSTEEDCGGNGWYGEQSLDVEAVHGMAPAANVLYYGAASCFDDDLLAQLGQVVSDNKASIVTNSWGEPTFVVVDGELFSTIDEPLVKAYESVFKQGAVQGIGFYFSSGDDGDDLEVWGYKHPDFPSGDPWVTSVGGTSLAIGKDNNRIFETGWGTQSYELSKNGKAWKLAVPFLYGAGGGYSEVFKRPWYQDGVVPPNTSGRAVPDIGLDGDPTTGMLVGETQNFPLASRYGPAGVIYGEFRLGGTSLASPLMAGVQAVAQGSSRLGFANPRIYQLAKKTHKGWWDRKNDTNPFYDVTPQGDAGNVRADYVNSINADDGITWSVRTFNHDSSLTTGPGWDDVTGVGSITAGYLDAIGAGW